MIYFLLMIAMVAYAFFFYCLGHSNAWGKWEDWTKGQLSDETQTKINGE